MFCMHSGSALPEGAAFCEYRGMLLPAAQRNSTLSDGLPNQQGPASVPAQRPGQRRPQGQGNPQTQSASPKGSQRQVQAQTLACQPRSGGAGADPRKQQIRARRLRLRQACIELQEVNMQLQQLRNQYGQGAPFVPFGLINRVYREMENIQLSGPQQRKQQLQQQIISLEQQILALQSQLGG